MQTYICYGNGSDRWETAIVSGIAVVIAAIMFDVVIKPYLPVIANIPMSFENAITRFILFFLAVIIIKKCYISFVPKHPSKPIGQIILSEDGIMVPK